MKLNFTLLCFFISMTYVSLTAQNPNPVLYLNFNNNLNDISGNQLNVTGIDYSYNNGACSSNGVYVNGTLNSPYSYIQVDDNSVIEPRRKLTVAAWAKYTDTDRSIRYGYVVSKRYDYYNTPYNSYGIYVNNYTVGGHKKWVADIGNNSGLHSVASQDTALIGEWTHLAMTFNDSLLSLYVNGQFQNSTVINTEDIIYSNLPLYVGTSRPNGGNTQFKGNIDEVYVFDEVLSDALIQDLANCLPITSTEKINSEIQVSVFPNPANNSLFINGLEDEQIKSIEIYNNLGQLVLKKSNLMPFNDLDISGLQNGLYYLNIITEGQRFAKQTFTVLR